MNVKEVLGELKKRGNKKNLAGMKRYGINTKDAFGVPVYELRAMAKRMGKDHKMAQGLWNSGVHEARVMASMVDVPERVTEKQMEKWVRDFDSWDLCDQVCSNLFDKTEFAWDKALSWAESEKEFVRRAGFVLMAALSVHDKEAGDKEFNKFFPVIKKHAADSRNFVKKAVNWALRQIGKRSSNLNKKAVRTAEEIREMDSSSARWIAADALRELGSEKVQRRFAERERGV
jgi:3-methyladenine DNA glycosylase AlkD